MSDSAKFLKHMYVLTRCLSFLGVINTNVPSVQATNPNTHTSSDLWSEVEDFKWLKSGPSPNWSLLDDGSSIPETVWSQIASGVPGWSLDDILKAVRVL